MGFQFGFEGLQDGVTSAGNFKTAPCSCRGDGKRSVSYATCWKTITSKNQNAELKGDFKVEENVA